MLNSNKQTNNGAQSPITQPDVSPWNYDVIVNLLSDSMMSTAGPDE